MNPLPDWPRALEARFGPRAPGQYRQVPEDFFVDEQLDFTPQGEGEHVWLRLEKRGLTTLEVVKHLARLCEVAPRAIGYSGMKDKIAVTRQWLSVHLPGRPSPEGLEEALAVQGIRLVEQGRHPRKLKRGVHRTNRFRLRVSGEAVETEAFAKRWEALCREGVANYFGPQRFGAQGRNLEKARAVLQKGWRKRDDRQGMLLSTARAFLFNEFLSARVGDGSWHSPVPGDTLMLDGTQSVFSINEVDETLTARAEALDLHPAGPLWGVGEAALGKAGALEQALYAREAALCDGLNRAGVKKSHRALRMRVIEPVLTREADAVVLAFSLPRGGFATALLRELIDHPDF
ncbi:tRNA pseudouridine(13) synthase TruD [Halomonas sp. PAMB 3232]|uniref:tRNA pseudouridine(13) synthase TruD n=1 Tax=Halomonas sp. PAMB 3232 TaxID=3075221 RepID=UPI00289A3DCC|nr:tRNA pseudouridine(13) synthase TruD [Halomonas sp. PAMB 3232]WNL39752.1 tRNA pseudouridine(13) synthase TruD [Halomonas sp. PAMB 3232]